MNRHLARGVFLALVALGFGLGSLRYNVGRLDHAGPGLFPLMVSALLLLVALGTLARALLEPPEHMEVKVSNIGLILGSLCAFALVSKLVNMSAGIVVMVFLATAAGRDYSWVRNLKISAGLLAIAFGFQKLLGLNLPLL